MADQNNAAASSSDSRLPFVFFFFAENGTSCLQLQEQVERALPILIWERNCEREKEGDIQTDVSVTVGQFKIGSCDA